MSGIKLMFVVLFSCMFIVFLIDTTRIFQANIIINNALSQAVNTGLTKTLNEQDLIKGDLKVIENKAKQEVRQMLSKNLRLNDQLENENYKQSDFDSKINYEEQRVKMTARFTTHIPIYVGRIFGLKTFPIKFVKTKGYDVDYI